MKFNFKAFFHKHHKLILIVAVILIVLIAAIAVIYASKHRAVAPSDGQQKTETPASTPPPEEAKKEIAKNPPKHKASGNMSGSAKTNPDGSQTVSVFEGSSNPGDLGKAQTAGPSGSIAGIDYIDETGGHPGLGDELKNYLSSALLHAGEVSSLYAVILKNAGDTGWAGLYSASYTQQPNGDITSAWGYITLNSYYYEGNPYFTDYMKLILSHEYGHHYTLYYKWVVWDLGVGVRFPDSYYDVRPLSKATTAPDYSLGWSNCDCEIIAEDYSYLYSGYGYHAMAGTYGYPSAGTRTWLINEPNGPGAPPAGDNPPAVSVSEPANGATLSGSVNFAATASDDNGVSKVEFYIDSTSVVEDTSVPYSTTLNTTSYGNGGHTLKAKAFDTAGQSAESSISVTISNTGGDSENPSVNIVKPEGNPYSWTSGDLYIKVTALDNVAVQKIELYINDYLVATENDGLMERIWSWNNVGPGTYIMRAKAFDTSNNTSETSITINKS